MAYKKLLHINVRVSDVEDYGVHTALVLGCIRSWSGWQGDEETGKCYLSLKDIAYYTGLSYNTVQRNLPTEEMGWKRYSGYKPGTLEKTTWWEPVPVCTDKKSETPSQSTSIEATTQSTSNIYNKNNKVYAPNTHSGCLGARTPSDFPCGGENGEAAQQEGGVVKITTPPTVVDLQKKQTATAKRKKEFDFCQELMLRMGITGVRVGGVFHKRIMQLKAQGYDDETLRMVAEEAKVARLKDDFYAEPMKVFSESGVSGLLAKRDLRKTKDPLRDNWDFQV